MHGIRRLKKVLDTRPVSSEVIEKSKSGEWEITVTTEKSVPRKWFPKSLDGLKILCLASGGGQQAPVLGCCWSRCNSY